ncbi:MAG: GAF domain-containing protein [Alphaproteobacteria bacterium]|nr:GAF domain-containing protein [Alphaproteobacteria bacterium]
MNEMRIAGNDGWYTSALEYLVRVAQDLCGCQSMDEVTAIVRKAARELTGADGATLILKDNGNCFYVEENAISPLWKGQRFPMSNCISGWVMMHKQTCFIEDVSADSRIPYDLYRPTFVKSLLMVPIMPASPIGAIGNYWATSRMPLAKEIKLLESLANITAYTILRVRGKTDAHENLGMLELA